MFSFSLVFDLLLCCWLDLICLCLFVCYSCIVCVSFMLGVRFGVEYLLLCLDYGCLFGVGCWLLFCICSLLVINLFV